MLFLGKQLKIGTRGSALALWQASFVKDKLENHGITSEIIKIKTTGDVIKDKPLYQFGGKGLFTKEIEKQLIDKNIDIAVHSLKDVTVFDLEDFDFLFLKRDSYKDVLVSHKGDLSNLPSGASVGTTSLRRQFEIYSKRRDLNFVSLRGNLDTRLKKLERGEVDAIVVSKSGLLRLGIFNKSYMYDIDIVPSAGQGVVAVQFLKNDEMREKLSFLEDEHTRMCVSAERQFVRELNASCNYPIGAYAYFQNNKYCMNVAYGVIDNIEKVIHFQVCSDSFEEAVDDCVKYVRGAI